MTSAIWRGLIGPLLGRDGPDWDRAVCTEVAPDGSSRRFCRVRTRRDAWLAVLPPEGEERGLDEARSFVRIGLHLRACGAPTPEIHGFDFANGLVVCEDLGDCHLFDLVTGSGEAAALPWYEQTVRQLARMQVRGAVGFDPDWCWDTGRYDQALMLERESGYFLRACCVGLLGLQVDRPGLEADFSRLARTAGQAPAGFFLHRDFQSRNIMVTGNQVRFIDFQGGRFGPLAYDLASLLLDPYAGLSAEMQARLLDCYLDGLTQETAYDPEQFRREYLPLALQRNLQILGAFAFLSQVRRKPFFARYLRPALNSLAGLLARPGAEGYAALRAVTDQCRQQLDHLHPDLRHDD